MHELDGQTSSSTDQDPLLEAVIADYIRACEEGGSPDRLQLLDQHPEVATDLLQFFSQRDRMNQIAEPVRCFSDDLLRTIGPGQQVSYVGNYELLQEIARGGMGVVYKARQTTLGRIVAVKMIVTGRLASEDDIRRFQVEAEAAANLQHRHIVAIHEVGQQDGWHYFSMDFVYGRDLSAILREKLLSATQAATYVRQMAEAIEYAHRQGTLHRDLKPSNILIDEHDQIRITDFGLAMRVEEESDLTRTGQIVGTPSYMPPEQAQGKRNLIGPGSDVYSMGAILYECLTGRPPFRAESVVETIQQVIHVDVASPQLLNPSVPRDLNTICMKCLEKEPHRRYATAQRLADDLQHFLEGKPIAARRISRSDRAWRWCRRNPAVSSLAAIILAMSILAGAGGVVLRQIVLEQQRSTRVESLVIGLTHADTSKVPAILNEIGTCRLTAEPFLRRQFDSSPDHSLEKLHVALALLPADTTKVEYLRDELLVSSTTQFPLVRDALLPYRRSVVEWLWEVAVDPQDDSSRRFLAACALAEYAPDDDRWNLVGAQVADQLVALQVSELVAWRVALRPARKQLIAPLSKIYRLETAREQQRIYATETLADFAGDMPETLFGLLIDAESFQFGVIFKALQKYRRNVIELGNTTLSIMPAVDADEIEKETVARRRANAAIALYGLGATEKVWLSLKQSQDSRARSYFIHGLAARAEQPKALLQQLDIEKDVSIRRALVLALGEFPELQIPPNERSATIAKLLQIYRHDPDSGLHSATEWLLRKWGYREALRTSDEQLMGELPPDSQQWHVNMQGQTFVVLEPAEFAMGSPQTEVERHPGEVQHRRHLAHRFAISSHEVTQAQFGASSVPAVTYPPNAHPADLPQIANWYQAAAYCNWLSRREGLPPDQWCYVPNSQGHYAAGMRAKPKACELSGYRLPTEAEWEYACRAGSVTSRYYGATDALLMYYACYQRNPDAQLQPVGLLKPNDAGLFDMLGNAYEWCHDLDRPYAQGSDGLTESALYEAPVANTARRILRGGAFSEYPLRIRSASRASNVPDINARAEGFRVARTYTFPTAEDRATESAYGPLARDIRWLQLKDARGIGAADRLGQQGLRAKPAIPALRSALHDSSNGPLQVAAARALGQIGPVTAGVLIEAAANSNSRHAATQGLLVLEQHPAEAAKAIRESLLSPDQNVRRAAVLALRRMVGEFSVIDDLRVRLKDADAGVRHTAAFSLGESGSLAQPAIPSLIEALHDENANVARTAAFALARIEPALDVVTDALISIVTNGNQDQRTVALAVLGKIGPAAKVALPQIEAALKDQKPGVRVVARQALRRIDPARAEMLLGPPFDAVAESRSDRATLCVGDADWPQWGGSRLRNNTPTGQDIPTDWDLGNGHNIKWMSKLGSQTYGNPTVANGRVFIGTNNANGYLKRFPAKIDLGVMLCIDEATGGFLWQYSSPKLPTGRVHDWPLQGMPSTTVVDGDRVWAVTNRCEVICLDAEGFRDGENDGPFCNEPNENLDEADVVWRFDMMKELGVSPHNMSNCSMVLVDGVLFICTSNGVDDSHVRLPAPSAPSFMAMDCMTAKVLWTDNSPGTNILHSQWASPSYAVFAGQPQVIFPGGDGWVYSFDPKGNGQGGSRLLWKFDANPKESLYVLGGRATRNHVIAFPAIYDGLVYVTVGEDPEHGEGTGHLWCIDPAHRTHGEDVSAELAVDSAGSVIPHKRLQAVDSKLGERAVANPNSAVCWHYASQDRDADGRIEFEEQFHRSLGTPVIKDDILYVTDFSGMFHCLNAKTGDLYWNIDLFSACWGSALLVDGKVYVGDEDGDVAVFNHSADPAIAMPGGTPLFEINMLNSVYSTPIVANNVLYIATKNCLFAIQQPSPNSPPGSYKSPPSVIPSEE